MTCSTVKTPRQTRNRILKAQKSRRRQQQKESLAIARRNLFDNEASFSNDTRAKPSTPRPKTLREHSLPSSADFQNPIALPAEQTGRIVDSRDILLIQGVCTFQGVGLNNPSQLISKLE
ncbi:hypothetical protein Tco_1422151 [Tanacetum coccineum]